MVEKVSRFLILLFFSGLVQGCMQFQRSAEMVSAGDAVLDLADGGVSPDLIEIETAFGKEKTERDAGYILDMILPLKNGKERYSLSCRIKEESFIKDFAMTNSVALELVFFLKKEGKEVMRVLIAEETQNSIVSYPYLCSLLKRGIRKSGL